MEEAFVSACSSCLDVFTDDAAKPVFFLSAEMTVGSGKLIDYLYSNYALLSYCAWSGMDTQ